MSDYPITQFPAITHLEADATVGPGDDHQLAVEPLLAEVEAHGELLPHPEGGQEEGAGPEAGGGQGQQVRHGVGGVGQGLEDGRATARLARGQNWQPAGQALVYTLTWCLTILAFLFTTMFGVTNASMVQHQAGYDRLPH